MERNYWKQRSSTLGRRRFIRGAAVAGGGLAAAALVGCGGDDEDGPTNGATATQGGATGTAAAGETQAASGSAKSGGTFRARFEGDPPGFDIGRAASVRAQTTSLNYSWLTSLKFGPGVGYRESTIVADAAEALPEQPDGETYIFKLRPGIKFWNVDPVNGREVVAEDVAETTRYIADSYTNDWRGFSSVETPDDYTIIIKTDGPYAPLMNNLSGQYGVLLAPRELVGTEQLANRPVGTGPYIFDTYEEGSRIVQKRNPDYWNTAQAPYLDEIQFLTIPEVGSAIAAFRAGDLDWLTGHTCHDAEQVAQEMPEAVVIETPGTSGWYGMDQRTEMFADLRVRQAVALGYNRERDTNAVFCGRSDIPGLIPSDEAIHPTDYPDADKWLSRNVEEARKLMTAAGYADGFDTNLQWTPHYGQDYQTQMEGMVGDMREIGINVTLESHEYGQWIESVYRPPYNFSGLHGGATGRFYPDPDGYVAYWLHPDGIANHSQVNDPQMTELIERQVTQTNPDERWETLHEIQLREFENMYYVWRNTGILNTFVQPYVRDFNPHASYNRRELLPVWLDI
mgnify:CR=1 FL=1